MSIDWDDVVALAPALEDLEEAAQDLILEHVALLVGPKKWGRLQDMGQIYLAAHLGTLVLRSSAAGGSQAVGPVQSESVGDVSRTYAVLGASGGGLGASIGSTDWGREYRTLLTLLPSRFGQVL